MVLAAFFSTPLAASADNALVAVGPQYDTTHVYVDTADTDRFVSSFTATFGGASTKQITTTVTPTPSSTSSQLIRTPVGAVSLFGFKTPMPYQFDPVALHHPPRDID